MAPPRSPARRWRGHFITATGCRFRFYNVGTGRRTSIKELAELALRCTGSNQPIEYLPQGLTFVKNRVGSPVRAAEELGFTAAVELEEGLRRLIEWRQADRQTRMAAEQAGRG